MTHIGPATVATRAATDNGWSPPRAPGAKLAGDLLHDLERDDEAAPNDTLIARDRTLADDRLRRVEGHLVLVRIERDPEFGFFLNLVLRVIRPEVAFAAFFRLASPRGEDVMP